MIVRISGEGQFELTEEQVQKLHELDEGLTDAFHEHNDHAFHHSLKDMVTFVRAHGTPLHAERLMTSDVIVPPEDVTISEAEKFFSDEGLMHSPTQ